MKLIKLTLIAAQIVIFFGICAIMLFHNVVDLFTSLLVICLIGVLVFINNALSSFDKTKKELEDKIKEELDHKV